MRNRYEVIVSLHGPKIVIYINKYLLILQTTL